MNKLNGNMNGMGNMAGMRSNTGDSRIDMDLSNGMANIKARASNDLIGMGRKSTGRRNRYSSQMMDMDVDLSGMSSMNKISPEGAANHWFWNEDDF